jgi:hypothetical protein
LTALSKGPGRFREENQPAEVTPFDGAVERALAAFDKRTAG